MDRTLKTYIILLVLLIIGVIFIDANTPKAINWTPTYSTKDKIPFGLYIFNEELKSMYKDQKIENLSVTPYEYLVEKYDYDTLVNNYKVKGNYFFVSEFCELDNESVKELTYFVSHGNTAFLSAKSFPNLLQDSLKIKMDSEYDSNNKIYNWVTNKNLGTKKYNLIEGVSNNYFSKIDTLNTTVLGYQSQDSTRVNFIKVNYKGGHFILHTQPAAFTNFHMLKNNHHEYAEKVISYLPKADFFISMNGPEDKEISASPMRYWLNQPALKWAWWLFLMGIAVFMIFNAKRKQRVVPIKKPLANTTVDFTKTIGNLYFQEGDHDNIINKKIVYFLEKIRNEYLIDTTKLDDDFVKKLHQKSGKDMSAIQKVVFLINTHRRSPHDSIEEDLIQINKAIENILH